MMNTDPAPFEQKDTVARQEPAPRQTRPRLTMPPGDRLFPVLRALGWSLLLILGLRLMVLNALVASQRANDFCQDYLAARQVLLGMSPYSPLLASPDYHLCMSPLTYDAHPPFSVLLVLPLGLLPRVAASTCWAVLALACYLACGALLLKALGWWTLRGAALFVAGSLVWVPFSGSQYSQNFAEVLMLLVLASWLLERSGHQSFAGIALGLAVLLKIWPLVLFAIVLIRRRDKLALAGAATILLGTLATVLAFGFQTYATYLGPVLHQEAVDVPQSVNVSLAGALARLWTGFDDPAILVFSPLFSGLSVSEAVLLGEGAAALLVLGTLALVVWGLRHAQGKAMEWVCRGLLVTALLLGFPISWNWGVITLLLPLGTTLLALRHLPRPPRWWFVVLGLGLALLVNPERLPFLMARAYPLFASAVFSLPTLGLLLFALAQAQLLFWAANLPKAHSAEKAHASA
jgi:hypothetical protein